MGSGLESRVEENHEGQHSPFSSDVEQSQLHSVQPIAGVEEPDLHPGNIPADIDESDLESVQRFRHAEESGLHSGQSTRRTDEAILDPDHESAGFAEEGCLVSDTCIG